MAFLDESTLAAGDADSVKAAIDRHAAAAVFAGPLADRARQISAVDDVWLASLTPAEFTRGSAGAAQNQFAPIQNLLQSAQQLSAGLKFAATQVTLSAEVLARTAQDAQSMADVLKFLAGMLQQANSNASPNSSPNSSKPPALADAAKIYVSGSSMHVTLSVPEQQMEQFFVPNSKQPDSKQPGSSEPAVSGQPKKAA